MTLISAKSVGKKYDSNWVLRDVSFDLLPGQCLIVNGRNGSGKSTLIRILAGLDRPTLGAVVCDLNYQTELGYSALDQAVFPNLTVLEHLSLAAEMRGVKVSRDDTIEFVGLEAHRNHQSQHLSSGLRSRLKIALAIQTSPKLLILDEPSVALDDAGKDLIERIVHAQKLRGGLIIASNDPEERRFGTHVIELA